MELMKQKRRTAMAMFLKCDKGYYYFDFLRTHTYNLADEWVRTFMRDKIRKMRKLQKDIKPNHVDPKLVVEIVTEYFNPERHLRNRRNSISKIVCQSKSNEFPYAYKTIVSESIDRRLNLLLQTAILASQLNDLTETLGGKNAFKEQRKFRRKGDC